MPNVEIGAVIKNINDKPLETGHELIKANRTDSVSLAKYPLLASIVEETTGVTEAPMWIEDGDAPFSDKYHQVAKNNNSGTHYALDQNGQLYVSTNHGKTWAEASNYNLPYVPAATDYENRRFRCKMSMGRVGFSITIYTAHISGSNIVVNWSSDLGVNWSSRTFTHEPFTNIDAIATDPTGNKCTIMCRPTTSTGHKIQTHNAGASWSWWHRGHSPDTLYDAWYSNGANIIIVYTSNGIITEEASSSRELYQNEYQYRYREVKGILYNTQNDLLYLMLRNGSTMEYYATYVDSYTFNTLGNVNSGDQNGLIQRNDLSTTAIGSYIISSGWSSQNIANPDNYVIGSSDVTAYSQVTTTDINEPMRRYSQGKVWRFSEEETTKLFVPNDYASLTSNALQDFEYIIADNPNDVVVDNRNQEPDVAYHKWNRIGSAPFAVKGKVYHTYTNGSYPNMQALSEDGELWTSTDAGKSWNKDIGFTLPLTPDLSGNKFVIKRAYSANVFFAMAIVGGNAYRYVSTDNGRNWDAGFFGTGTEIQAVAIDDTGTRMTGLVKRNSTHFKHYSGDSGTTFSSVQRDMDAENIHDAWLVPGTGRMVTWNDDGVTIEGYETGTALTTASMAYPGEVIRGMAYNDAGDRLYIQLDRRITRAQDAATLEILNTFPTDVQSEYGLVIGGGIHGDVVGQWYTGSTGINTTYQEDKDSIGTDPTQAKSFNVYVNNSVESLLVYNEGSVYELDKDSVYFPGNQVPLNLPSTNVNDEIATPEIGNVITHLTGGKLPTGERLIKFDDTTELSGLDYPILARKAVDAGLGNSTLDTEAIDDLPWDIDSDSGTKIYRLRTNNDIIRAYNGGNRYISNDGMKTWTSDSDWILPVGVTGTQSITIVETAKNDYVFLAANVSNELKIWRSSAVSTPVWTEYMSVGTTSEQPTVMWAEDNGEKVGLFTTNYSKRYFSSNHGATWNNVDITYDKAPVAKAAYHIPGTDSILVYYQDIGIDLLTFNSSNNFISSNVRYVNVDLFGAVYNYSNGRYYVSTSSGFGYINDAEISYLYTYNNNTGSGPALLENLNAVIVGNKIWLDNEEYNIDSSHFSLQLPLTSSFNNNCLGIAMKLYEGLVLHSKVDNKVAFFETNNSKFLFNPSSVGSFPVSFNSTNPNHVRMYLDPSLGSRGMVAVYGVHDIYESTDGGLIWTNQLSFNPILTGSKRSLTRAYEADIYYQATHVDGQLLIKGSDDRGATWDYGGNTFSFNSWTNEGTTFVMSNVTGDSWAVVLYFYDQNDPNKRHNLWFNTGGTWGNAGGRIELNAGTALTAAWYCPYSDYIIAQTDSGYIWFRRGTSPLSLTPTPGEVGAPCYNPADKKLYFADPSNGDIRSLNTSGQWEVLYNGTRTSGSGVFMNQSGTAIVGKGEVFSNGIPEHIDDSLSPWNKSQVRGNNVAWPDDWDFLTWFNTTAYKLESQSRGPLEIMDINGQDIPFWHGQLSKIYRDTTLGPQGLIRLGGLDGTRWESVDGGKSWVQDTGFTLPVNFSGGSTRIARAFNAEVMYCYRHPTNTEINIQVSTDKGRNWANVYDGNYPSSSVITSNGDICTDGDGSNIVIFTGYSHNGTEYIVKWYRNGNNPFNASISPSASGSISILSVGYDESSDIAMVNHNRGQSLSTLSEDIYTWNNHNRNFNVTGYLWSPLENRLYFTANGRIGYCRGSGLDPTEVIYLTDLYSEDTVQTYLPYGKEDLTTFFNGQSMYTSENPATEANPISHGVNGNVTQYFAPGTLAMHGTTNAMWYNDANEFVIVAGDKAYTAAHGSTEFEYKFNVADMVRDSISDTALDPFRYVIGDKEQE